MQPYTLGASRSNIIDNAEEFLLRLILEHFRALSFSLELADRSFMINPNRLRRPLVQPELYLPTWIFPEETLIAALSNIDEEVLQSIHLGHFYVSDQGLDLIATQVRRN